jgi:hypothetical protein
MPANQDDTTIIGAANAPAQAGLAGNAKMPETPKASLAGEERMAKWCKDHLDTTAPEHASLRAEGAKVGV